MGLNFRTSIVVIICLLMPVALRAAEIEDHARNMNAVGEAIRKYVGKTGHFPPAQVTSADGKPLLSWRVIILPYLGEQALFDKFQLDEPWDSQNNRKLNVEMPDVYHFSGNRGSGKTTLLAFQPLPQHPVNTLSNGRKVVDVRDMVSVTLSPYAPKGRKLGTFRNGVSAALTAVLASESEATEWSRPIDFELDFKQAGQLKKRLAAQNDHFLTLWGNGDVIGVPSSTSIETLLAVFDYNSESGVELQTKGEFLNKARKARGTYWRNENWWGNGFE